MMRLCTEAALSTVIKVMECASNVSHALTLLGVAEISDGIIAAVYLPCVNSLEKERERKKSFYP